MKVTAEHIEEAERRIRNDIHETPLLYSGILSLKRGAHVYLKLENQQHTGSFKARGALNKMLTIHESALTHSNKPKIITASTGNHGLGVARALQITGLSGKIVIPENASQAKVSKLKEYPVELIAYGKDSLETELFAKQKALDEGAIWISPYNDPDIIVGQGTVGFELTQQLQDISAVYVTVGGGGLISGIATWFSEHSPGTEIIGCLPENSPEMQLSAAAGHIVHLSESKPTLSDGSAGGMEEDSMTFPICQALVHRYILVSEAEIASAIRGVHQLHQERIEGAAGVAVAAMMKDGDKYKDQNIVAVLCGGNIDEEKFQKVING